MYNFYMVTKQLSFGLYKRNEQSILCLNNTHTHTHVWGENKREKTSYSHLLKVSNLLTKVHWSSWLVISYEDNV